MIAFTANIAARDGRWRLRHEAVGMLAGSAEGSGLMGQTGAVEPWSRGASTNNPVSCLLLATPSCSAALLPIIVQTSGLALINKIVGAFFQKF